MSKRMVDGDAIWTSDKLQQVPEEFRAEYAWVLPLAEANGCVEYNPAIIYRNCYAVLRPGWSPEKVEQLFTALEQAKMVFRFKAKYEPTDKERTWCFFIGMESRLPAPSDRAKFKFSKKIVPAEELSIFLVQDIETISSRYRDVIETTSRKGIGAGLGLGGGIGSGGGKGLSNQQANEQACGVSFPTEEEPKDNYNGKTLPADDEEEDEDSPVGCMCGNPQCPNEGNCAFCFRWSLGIHLAGQLGFEHTPDGWDEAAKPLSDKFTTHEEHNHILALTLWAFGRPDDNFWREKTSGMKALTTHILKGTLLRQFNEALLKPETWCRLYFISPPDGSPQGPCPFPHGISFYVPLSDEMKKRCEEFMKAQGPWTKKMTT